MAETNDATASPGRPSAIRWYAVVLGIAYLALLALGTWSMWQIAGGWWLGAVAGLIFAIGFIVVWALWLVPGSSRRLGHRERFTVHLVGGTLVVVLAAIAAIWIPALVTVSVLIMCDALNEQTHPST